MEESAGSMLLNKGRGFLAALKRRDTGAVSDVDEVVAGILKFIRTGGNDVLEGRQTLALLTQTARHVNAKHREHLRHSAVAEEDRPYADALEEITSFFGRLSTIRFKSDPEKPPGEELSEINLELFPALSSVQVSGVTVIHVKSGEAVSHVILNNHARFADGISVFPGCTHLEIEESDPLNIVRSIQGSITTLQLTSCDLSPLLPTLGAVCPTLHSLAIHSCGLTTIPECISSLSTLEALSLAGNPITEVAFIKDLPSLKTLDMSSCALVTVEGLALEGEDVSPLQAINISQNPLTLLQGIGPWHRNVTSVDASGCKISDWGQEIVRLSRLPMLTSLDLMGNPAYDLDPEMQKGARQMVIEVLSDIDDPAAFTLDGEKLTKAEVKLWQETFKKTARAPTVIEGDTEEWPSAVGYVEPATMVMSDESPVKGKAVKKKVKTRTVKQVKGEEVVVKARKKVEDKGVMVGGRGVPVGVQVGGGEGDGCEEVVAAVLAKVGSRLSDDTQYTHVRTDTFADWSNGLGLLALLHSCNASWIPDFHNLSPTNPTENVTRALTLAQTHLSVPHPSIGPAIMSQPLLASSYISLVLLEIQSWEATQYKAMQRFTQRLTDEIGLFRRQRATDKKTIHHLQHGEENPYLNRSQTHSDSIADSDGDTESDYCSS